MLVLQVDNQQQNRIALRQLSDRKGPIRHVRGLALSGSTPCVILRRGHANLHCIRVLTYVILIIMFPAVYVSCFLSQQKLHKPAERESEPSPLRKQEQVLR